MIRTLVKPDDLLALQRFDECCHDPDSGGHDVPKEKMLRLARLGVVRWLGFNRHEITEFGMAVLAAPYLGRTESPSIMGQRLYEAAMIVTGQNGSDEGELIDWLTIGGGLVQMILATPHNVLLKMPPGYYESKK